MASLENCLFCRWCQVETPSPGVSRYHCLKLGNPIRSSEVMSNRCHNFERPSADEF